MSCGVPSCSMAPVAHHGHAVRHAEGFVLVMRHVEKRHPDLTLDTPKLRLHGLAQLPIQGSRGLVQQEHVGLQHQCTRQSHALLLSAAELVWTARLQTGQLHAGRAPALTRCVTSASGKRLLCTRRPKATLSCTVRCGNRA